MALSGIKGTIQKTMQYLHNFSVIAYVTTICTTGDIQKVQHLSSM